VSLDIIGQHAEDWLVERQPEIEAALAKHHLEDGTLLLYDVSSSWLEGRCCELARFGHSRDSKPNELQIGYGLLCAANGRPAASEVFAGNTADPRTLSGQIAKLKERFALCHVVLVGDRGMITQARIEGGVEFIRIDFAQPQHRRQAGRGGGERQGLGGRQLGGGGDETREDHRPHQCAAALAGGPKQAVERKAAQHAEGGSDMAMRPGSPDRERRLARGQNNAALRQRPRPDDKLANAFDILGTTDRRKRVRF
jgi:hypothetical protein